MYTEFNHFFSLPERNFTHKSIIMPATSPLFCNCTT